MRGMRTKKHPKARLMAKRGGKTFGKFVSAKELEKTRTKPPPDTNRIPWFPPLPKPSTDA